MIDTQGEESPNQFGIFLRLFNKFVRLISIFTVISDNLYKYLLLVVWLGICATGSNLIWVKQDCRSQDKSLYHGLVIFLRCLMLY